MRKLNQVGSLLIPLIIAIVLCLGAGTFGAWAFLTRQDYKDNSDAKVAAAVVVAKEETSTQKDNEFVEREKNPLKPFKGPETFGTITFNYPKTWSGYVAEDDRASTPVDGFFFGDIVPGIQSDAAFGLRLQVVNVNYDQVLKQFETYVKGGKSKVSAYKFEKVSSVLGSRIDGQIDSKKQGVMILVPLRDKTIKLWTENPQYASDFEKIVLPSTTFVP